MRHTSARMSIRSPLKRLLAAVFNVTLAPLLALLLIFEEWGWEPLARLLGRLSRLPLWAQLEALIARLPPYVALITFTAPVLMLLPLKLLALYWISQGHTLLGLTVVLAAKMLGTAAVAWLFKLTQPALMQLAWFAHGYGRWKLWKDALIHRIKGSGTWQAASGLGKAVRLRVRAWLNALRT